jgi:hypothetical protein
VEVTPAEAERPLESHIVLVAQHAVEVVLMALLPRPHTIQPPLRDLKRRGHLVGQRVDVGVASTTPLVAAVVPGRGLCLQLVGVIVVDDLVGVVPHLVVGVVPHLVVELVHDHIELTRIRLHVGEKRVDLTIDCHVELNVDAELVEHIVSAAWERAECAHKKAVSG